VGFKNVVIANRNSPLSEADIPPFIDSLEALSYMKHAYHAWKLQVTIHELLGHGTGKLLTQSGPAEYNFDVQNPPINPLTGKPVNTWYRPGETWNSIFGDIAASLDECRAESVGSYLIADKELLAIFGFTDESDITADDCAYSLCSKESIPPFDRYPSNV
jgi:dipeptidyl-peptidase III